MTSQPVDEAIAALVTTAAFLRTRPLISRMSGSAAGLANMQFVSDPLRRGAEGAEQTPRRSRRDALQVTNDEGDCLSAQATKLAQYADLLCLCDLVRRNAEEKPRRAKSAADMRRLRSNAYDGLGTSRSLCAISSIDTSRKVRTLALFTKRAGRYMSQTQASPMETS